MTFCITIIICFLLSFSANAQIPIITFTGTGTLTQTIVNAQISGITSPFKVEINGYTEIISYAFAGAFDLPNPEWNVCRDYLVEVIAHGVETIGIGAFSSCISLQSVEFPIATTIGQGAFNGCWNLQSVHIPLVVTIDPAAFWSCSSLESAEFPLAVTIGNWTFRGCTGLKNLTFGEVPPTLEYEVFNDGFGSNNNLVANITLHIPKGSLCEYEKYWGNVSSYFAGVVEYPVANPITYALVVNSGANGSVTGSDPAVSCKSTKTITATPNSCYEFVSWTNSSNVVISTDNPFDVVVSSNTTFTANFTLAAHSLSVSSANTSQGSVTGSDVGITCGTTKQITATPNSCYEFLKWTNNNGDSVSNINPLDVDVIIDTTLTAHFTLAIHSLNVSSANTSQGSVTGSDANITCGTTKQITATPNSCYHFFNWTDGSNVEVSTDNPFDVVVDNDITLIANFIVDNITPRTFQAINANPTMGTVDYMPNVGTKTGSYLCNTPITATATPEPKHRFIGWYENNVLVSNSSSYIFTISGNRTLVGRFEKKPPTRIKRINVKKGRVRIKPIP